MKLLQAIIVTLMTIGEIALAQPTVDSVIFVGPAQWTPFLGPIHWSPNGAYVAYFNRDTLMVSDTLGNTRPISQFDWRPRRMGWVTDSTIALFLQTRFARDSILSRLVIVNTTSGNETLLRTCARNSFTQFTPENTYFDGPFYTIEGDAYISLLGGNNTKSPDRREYTLLDSLLSKSVGASHFISVHETGIYEVRLDQSDSIRIGPNPFRIDIFPTAISRDGRYAVKMNRIMSLSDSVVVDLGSLGLEIPDGTYGCGYHHTDVRPNHNEAFTLRSCDDGDSYEVSQSLIIDLGTKEVSFLDEIVSGSACSVGCYDQSGSRMAVLCSAGLYILKWSS